MVTSAVQYMLLATSYINILAVDAVSHMHSHLISSSNLDLQFANVQWAC
jgi:hypothetical protein